MCLPTWLRRSLDLHAVIENRRYHIFSPKKTRICMYMPWKSNPVNQSKRSEEEGKECLHFWSFFMFWKDIILCHLTLHLVKDQFHPLSKHLLFIILFLGGQKLPLLRNIHFFHARNNYGSVKKKTKQKRSKRFKYTSHNNVFICIYTAHFILKEKQQGYVFVLYRHFLYFKFIKIKTPRFITPGT